MLLLHGNLMCFPEEEVKRTQTQIHFVSAMPAITLEENLWTNTTATGLEEEHEDRSQHEQDVHPPSSSSPPCQVQPGSSCQIN